MAAEQDEYRAEGARFGSGVQYPHFPCTEFDWSLRDVLQPEDRGRAGYGIR